MGSQEPSARIAPEYPATDGQDAVRILRAPETRRACGTLLTMMAIAEHPTIGAKESGGYYQHFCGERGSAYGRRQCPPPERQKPAGAGTFRGWDAAVQ